MGRVNMGRAVAPKSLRSFAATGLGEAGYSGKKVSAVAGLIVVASVGGAEAQQSNQLPPVNVDAPAGRAQPAASSKPSSEHVRARNALRRSAQRAQPNQAAAVPFPNAGG